MASLSRFPTFVPLFSPVRSRVVPAGTATEDKTMVEQDFLFLIAAAAPLEPEKVQLEERSSRSDATVTLATGAGAGIAFTAAAPSRPTRQSWRLGTILKKNESKECDVKQEKNGNIM